MNKDIRLVIFPQLKQQKWSSKSNIFNVRYFFYQCDQLNRLINYIIFYNLENQDFQEMAIKKKSVTWRDHEDRSLCEMIEKKGKNWCAIARELHKIYGYKKTGRQCRQRWYNELDPNVLKSDWTETEQDILFQEHRIVGNKWKYIAEKLEGRSDNSIKNHFYSIIRRSLRWINKHLKGSKDGTKKVRSIKPAILSKFFSISSENETINSEGQSINSEKLLELRQVAYKMIDFSRKKINKNGQLEEQQKLNFLKFLQEVYTFNENTQYKGRSQKRSKLIREMSDSDFEIDSYSQSGSHKVYPKRNQPQKKTVQAVQSEQTKGKVQSSESKIVQQKTIIPNVLIQQIKPQIPIIMASNFIETTQPKIKLQNREQKTEVSPVKVKIDEGPLNDVFPFEQNFGASILPNIHDTLLLPYQIENNPNIISMLIEQVARLKQEVAQLKAEKRSQPSPIIFQGAIYVFPPSENFSTERANQFISYQTTIISGNERKNEPMG